MADNPILNIAELLRRGQPKDQLTKMIELKPIRRWDGAIKDLRPVGSLIRDKLTIGDLLPGTTDWFKQHYETVFDAYKVPHNYLETGKADMDVLPLNEVSFKALIRQVNMTLTKVVQECRNPDPKGSSDDIEAKLSAALRLVHCRELVENYIHDIDGPLPDSVEELERRFQREHPSRRDSASKKMYERLVGELNIMRSQERLLRDMTSGLIEDQWCGAPHFYDFISAAFDAALILEANFENKAYAETS